MKKITFQFENGDKSVETYAHEDESILEIAKKSNVAIDAPCGGNGACGKCRVRLLEGELSAPKTILLTPKEEKEGWHLACESKPATDVVISVPDIASAYKSRMKMADLDSPEEIAIFDRTREELRETGIGLHNDLEVIALTMDAPSLDDTMPDNERLSRALMDAAGTEKARIPYHVLRKLSEELRKDNFSVKCVVRKSETEAEVLDVRPAAEDVKIVGLAVDIGTTSVAAVLVDMENGNILAKSSTGNGQIRYGADVINRIIASGKEGGRKALQDAIIKETLTPMIAQMCAKAKIHTDQIYRASIAGNTTMNHLLMGVYADPIRMEPFIPTFFELDSVFADDIGLKINPHARLIISPNIGSYVGGDITAGTFASGIWTKESMSLFIDLGTNGELVFGNSEFMMSCACSAGPAFEGGDISCGMRATDGAIEAISIDRDSMKPTMSVIGDPGQKPVGVCGSGIIDLIAELYRCGIISPKGKFIREGERIRHDNYGMGSYVIAFADESATGRDVELTEVDIDSFIRAKAAIFSAIRTMLKNLDFTVDMIDDVYVAGGIGSGINMDNAVNIGMFPDIPKDKFHYIGNSSLTGAYAMLVSSEAETKVADIAHNITYLELSTEPGYMDEFVACCFLPHTDSSLFPSVTLK